MKFFYDLFHFFVFAQQPLSSMSPTMLLRNGGGDSSPGNKWGDLVMVVGGSGGPKIINAVLQVLLNVLFRKMSVFNAMASPRVHDQLLYHGSVVTTTEKVTLDGVDDGKHNLAGPTLEVPETTKRALLNRHHKLLDIDYTGCVQAILVDHESNTLSAASDMRKDGSPAGY
jgi:gamma-glutamyltranspeptidase